MFRGLIFSRTQCIFESVYNRLTKCCNSVLLACISKTHVMHDEDWWMLFVAGIDVGSVFIKSLTYRVNDDDDILMCAQKLTDASLIYRTETKTKTRKMEKLKNKPCKLQAKSVSLWVQSWLTLLIHVLTWLVFANCNV